MWCIKAINEEYLANMEDILALYAESIDEQRPRLCFDECPVLSVRSLVEPLKMKPGQAQRVDYEYQRLEPAVILLAYNMDTGQRHLQIKATKTKIDYAKFIADVMDTHYSHCQNIRLIQDNLATHTKGSFYKAFAPQKARNFAKKIEFHFTPKHASWLNMAEIEFSALSRQCLKRRFDAFEDIERETLKWVNDRNKKAIKIHWSFTVDMARDKLNRHYENVFSTQK